MRKHDGTHHQGIAARRSFRMQEAPRSSACGRKHGPPHLPANTIQEHGGRS